MNINEGRIYKFPVKNRILYTEIIPYASGQQGPKYRGVSTKRAEQTYLELTRSFEVKVSRNRTERSLEAFMVQVSWCKFKTSIPGVLHNMSDAKLIRQYAR